MKNWEKELPAGYREVLVIDAKDDKKLIRGMGIAALLSVVILAHTHIFLPAAATLLYAFLSIRLDDTTIIDYLRYAVKFFISTQQYFEWR